MQAVKATAGPGSGALREALGAGGALRGAVRGRAGKVSEGSHEGWGVGDL